MLRGGRCFPGRAWECRACRACFLRCRSEVGWVADYVAGIALHSIVAGEVGAPEADACGLGRVECVVAEVAGCDAAECLGGELAPTGARPFLVVVRVQAGV